MRRPEPPAETPSAGSPLELLLVTGAFPVRSQSFIENKVIALARAGHEVTVLAGGPGDHQLDSTVVAELGDHLRVEYLPHGTRWRRLTRSAAMAASAVVADPGFSARLVVALGRRHGLGRQFWRRLDRGLPLAGRRQPVIHFEWATKAAACPEALELLPAATVVSCRGTDVLVMAPDDPRFAADLRRVFSAVDAVHCVSGAVLAAAEALGLPRAKAFVNHPAVDCDWFDGLSDGASDGASEGPDASGPIRIVSVGRIHWVKGYDFAVRAVRLLTDRGLDVTYTIVGAGDGPSTAVLRSMVDELGIVDRVDLAGARSPVQVKEALARSHIFLLPSRSEGMSNSALEAMAMEVPVVVTDVGGMAELVRDGVDGYLVASGDVVGMADRLEDLARSPDMRARMGDAARARVCESFSPPRQIAAFVEVYERLLERRRSNVDAPR